MIDQSEKATELMTQEPVRQQVFRTVKNTAEILLQNTVATNPHFYKFLKAVHTADQPEKWPMPVHNAASAAVVGIYEMIKFETGEDAIVSEEMYDFVMKEVSADSKKFLEYVMNSMPLDSRAGVNMFAESHANPPLFEHSNYIRLMCCIAYKMLSLSM